MPRFDDSELIRLINIKTNTTRTSNCERRWLKLKFSKFSGSIFVPFGGSRRQLGSILRAVDTAGNTR